MEIGAHLPLIPFSEGAPSPAGLRAYAAAASRLGYRWLSANDHLVFRRPWLDGLTALAAVLDVSGDLGLATTICLPAVRGPAQAAKAFAALDLLSDGRFVAGLGPGSSERDYVVGGVPAEDRFARFEEAVRAVRALLGRDRRALHRPLLLDRRRHARAAPRASRTAAHLAGRLGWLTRAAARGGARRRLARLRLQHHAGALRRLVGARSGTRRRPRRRPRSVRQRHRHALGLRHRGPRRGRSGARRRPLPAARTARRVAARALAADRPGGGLRGAPERLRARGGPATVLLAARGRACASSSCSPSAWCRASPRPRGDHRGGVPGAARRGSARRPWPRWRAPRGRAPPARARRRRPGARPGCPPARRPPC